MPDPVYTTAHLLARLVQDLPIGTNLALAQVLFCIMAGHLLPSRGALIPALAAAGLRPAQVLRAAAAVREGSWSMPRLLASLNRLLAQEPRLRPLTIGGWRPLLLDWVGFFRPRLAHCSSSHYDSCAGKELPALELGMLAVPLVAGSRSVPQLKALTRSGDTLSLLQEATRHQEPDQVLVADRQVKVSQLHRAGIGRFVVRAAVNLVVFRKRIPEQPPGKKGRKPHHGERVRPIARTYRGRSLGVTAPDGVESLCHRGRSIACHWFHGLVVPRCPVEVSVLVVHDTRYKAPWLLVTDLVDQSAQTLFDLYRSRWHVEMLPLTGKQSLGAARSFVHGEASRYRLPELSLLAASVSLCLSALSPACPTGFWDRAPEATAGRLRRRLWGCAMPVFEAMLPLGHRVRQKQSVHRHLSKGVDANRRRPGQRATAKGGEPVRAT